LLSNFYIYVFFTVGDEYTADFQIVLALQARVRQITSLTPDGLCTLRTYDCNRQLY